MNDDNLNYRFRLITFNDNISVKDPDPEAGIPSVIEEPKAPKYSVTRAQMTSDTAGTAARDTARPMRLSKSSSEIMAKRNNKYKVLRKRRNTISVEDLKRMFLLQDNMYADKLLQETSKDRKIKEKVKNNKKKSKRRHHHKWQKDVKVIYTSETTKIPRRGRTHQPPDPHENCGDFEPLNKKYYLQQNLFKNNPAVYFQSSGDCRRGIFGKFKKSREKDVIIPCEHFPVAYIGDNCEEESCANCLCLRDPSHFNVIRFPQESKTLLHQPQQVERDKCRRSLTTVTFHDPELDTNCRAFCSQPCQSVGQSYECEPMSNICKMTPNNDLQCGTMSAPVGTCTPKTTSFKVCEGMPKKTCECEPSEENPCSKSTSEFKTTKKTSAKLCCKTEVKSKKKHVKYAKPNQTCAVDTQTKKTCPKLSQCRNEIPIVPAVNATKNVFKFIFYAITAIAWFPCVVLLSLCWLATYPLRPREVVPCKLAPPCTQNKPRGRNLCHFNRAPKVLLNTIDNWATFRHVVAGACKSTLPSCQRVTTSRSCSTKPCSSSPLPCKKTRSRSNSTVTFEPCPITVPPCTSKIPSDLPRACEWKRHPDPSEQYRMYYGGALRGWLMKPLSCYGTTSKSKGVAYGNVCPTTVMGVGDVFRKKPSAKKPAIAKSKISPTKSEPRRGLFKGKNASKQASKTNIKEKKAVKFSQDISPPASASATPPQQPPQPKSINQVRKGENRPCTEPKRKKPCKVCCQKITPRLDPKSVGFVRYAKGTNAKNKNEPKTNSKVPFKKKQEAAKEVPKEKKVKKVKGKKKKKIKKLDKEQFKGLVQSIRDAENEAWGTEEVRCDEVWVRTLRKKPCFWIYKKWPGMYPCFLTFHSCFANCASCCLMCVSTIFWCPLLICLFICFKSICRK